MIVGAARVFQKETMMKSKGTTFGIVLLLIFHLGATDKPDAGGQLHQLRFSWDGKYVLAQDASEITVLAVDPFAVLFRIPAENATLAQFTPDSKQLAFVSSATLADPARIAISRGTPHVERWSVPDGARIAPIELPGWTCGSMALAPDLRTFTCDDFEGTLRAIDLPTSEKILEIKKFMKPWYTFTRLQWHDIPTDLGAAGLEFSPDGRILVATGGGGPSGGSTIIWNVPERHTIRAKGLLRMLNPDQAAGSTFLTSDRMLIICEWKWGKHYNARIATVPDGTAVARVIVPLFGEMRRAADPAFLIVSNVREVEYLPLRYMMAKTWRPTERSAAVELTTGQAINSGTSMLDVFGNHYIAEVRPGEIGIYERGKGLQASIALRKK